MKKIIYLLMLALPCLMLGACDNEVVRKVQQTKDSGLSDGFLYYKITSNTSESREVMVSGCEEHALDVEIPTAVELNGEKYCVTSIGSKAFWSGILTSITIPNSVTSIGTEAFAECYSLISLTIPNSVTSIEENAFASCTGLTSLTIPNSVTSIEDNAFSGCNDLKSITVEEGNTKYDSRDNCNAIIRTTSNTLIAGCKNTTIPNSVTSIGNEAFYDCCDLTSVKIPNSVTSIGEWAFFNCSGLTTVAIPNSVTSIGDEAFTLCVGLTSVTCLVKNPPRIGYNSFSECDNLTTLHVLPVSKATYEKSKWKQFFKNIVEDAME